MGRERPSPLLHSDGVALEAKLKDGLGSREALARAVPSLAQS